MCVTGRKNRNRHTAMCLHDKKRAKAQGQAEEGREKRCGRQSDGRVRGSACWGPSVTVSP